MDLMSLLLELLDLLSMCKLPDFLIFSVLNLQSIRSN